MINIKKNHIPVYMQIAVDMAGRINRNEFKAGQRISGRSVLASDYNVSPETIRKAMRLLTDMDVVEIKYGDGIYVSSYEKAEIFIRQYHARHNILKLKDTLLELMEKRKIIEDEMNSTMNEIIDLSGRFKHMSQIIIYEQEVPQDSKACGNSLESLEIWSNTGATVIGIIRDGVILLSPGPHESLTYGDRLLFVGEIGCNVKVHDLL